ncbi:MAG: histone deacetylase family protein [Nitrospiria bacterium]
MKMTGFITHPLYLRHETGPGHPETSRRLTAIQDRVTRPDEGSGGTFRSQLAFFSPSLHPELSEWIVEVHHHSYYQALRERAPQRGRIYLDPDTPCSPESLAAAEMAVSGVLTAADRVMEGTVENAFCALRPPGHHAEPDHAMGFCLFNNVAIGARYLQKMYQLKRIFILDWDVHHGNGTQHRFYDDQTVFYFSTHQYPFYPGTGSEQERGDGDGEGFTCNCPLPAGSGDLEILSAFENNLIPAVEAFRPDFIMISAGFDAHRDDPLANLEVTETGFGEMTKVVKSLAERYCQGRIISCLEGGYNLDALARSVESHLEVLSAPPH